MVRNRVCSAVCLDGSPPAYHWDKGFGAGMNNWLVHIEGGGWCNNITTCLSRKNTRLGSSKQMAKEIAFSGIMSKYRMFNPESRLGTAMGHHLLVMWKQSIQPLICTSEEQGFGLLSLRICYQKE
ncbi:hypothetical protein I3843_12G053000 [Carya illinoinensis]|nr:hypothetical protein I3843_12G053000 [Carya illinoinensis]KAG7952315.1 hypothetical protein I3843_12G053000 [Carya illinoinensis]